MKKLLYWLAPRFFTVEKKTVVNEVVGKKGDYTVVIVEDDVSGELPFIFGVTQERMDELAHVTIDAVKKHKYVANALVDVSKECKHQNELIFAFFGICKITQQGMRGPSIDIQDILDRLKRGGGEEL